MRMLDTAAAIGKPDNRMTTVKPLDDLLSQSDIQGKKVFLRADLMSLLHNKVR